MSIETTRQALIAEERDFRHEQEKISNRYMNKVNFSGGSIDIFLEAYNSDFIADKDWFKEDWDRYTTLSRKRYAWNKVIRELNKI